MPLSRPGPALAILFALGMCLRGSPPCELSVDGTPLPGDPILRWCFAALAILLLAAPRRWRRGLLLPALILLLGALRAGGVEEEERTALPPEGPAKLTAWVAEVPVILEGLDRPGRRTSRSGSPIEERRLLFSTEDPRLRVTVAHCGQVPGDLFPGAIVELEGLLSPPWAGRNPGDPAPRAPRTPVLRVEKPSNLRTIGSAPFRHPVEGAVLLLRERAHRILERLYPAPTSGFMIAMLLGDRRLLAPEHLRLLSRTGTIHFLAVSGLNVALAMALVLRLPLPAPLRLPARLGFLLVFTLVTGAAPPVARAALMLTLHLAGHAFGRSPRPLDTLGWTVVILLGIEPLWVRDLGFWLSAAAVFFLIAAPGDRQPADVPAPIPARSRVPPFVSGAAGPLLRSLSLSTATSIGTAPIILLRFCRIHPLGPIWNLLASPLVNSLLNGGALSVVLGSISPSLGAPPAWLTRVCCDLLFRLLAVLEKIPGSCVYWPPPPAWGALAAEVLLALGCFPEFRRRAIVGLAILALALGGEAFFSTRPSEVVVQDVGSGLAALLEAPGSGKGGGTYLIDCGSGRVGPGTGERLARSLLHLGVRRLDGAILSHSHADHTGSLLELAEILPVGSVWTSPLFDQFPSGAALLRELRKRGIGVETATRGRRLESGLPGSEGGLRIELLRPAEGEILPLARRPNDGSLVVRAIFPGGTVLFPGDIEEEGTIRLLESEDDLRCDVLILPHHARRNPRLGDLLDRAQPKLTIASGDGRGGGLETIRMIRERGIPCAATWEQGAVRVLFDHGAPRVLTNE